MAQTYRTDRGWMWLVVLVAVAAIAVITGLVLTGGRGGGDGGGLYGALAVSAELARRLPGSARRS